MSSSIRGQTVQPGVSPFLDIRKRTGPSSVTLIPARAASFSLDDLHGTSDRRSRRRYPTGHLPVRRSSGGNRVDTAGTESRRPRAGTGAADLGKRTRPQPLVAPSSLRQREPFSGLTGKVCASDTRHRLQQRNFTDILEVPGAHMMYTITRGPSKLVTQRRTGRYGAMTQRDIIRLLLKVFLHWGD